MTTDPKGPRFDIGQDEEERQAVMQELEETAPEDTTPPPAERGAPSSDDEFTALQAQGLGSGALGTDPSTRRRYSEG